MNLERGQKRNIFCPFLISIQYRPNVLKGKTKMNSQLFTSTLWQMFFLVAFLGAGYFLAKINFLPDGSDKVLSRLENALFVPALILVTFFDSFTVENLSKTGNIFLLSSAIALLLYPISRFLAKLCDKDAYQRNIYTYGLWFANFGFMGNAVVKALFPAIFYEYLIFTVPLYICIYGFAVPFLLLPPEGEKRNAKSIAKSFLNPMFVCMLLGAAIGLSGLHLPDGILSPISVAADCMSPVAMILTGITVAKCDLRKVLKQRGIYLATVLRLVLIPTAVIGLLCAARAVFSLEESAFFATFASLIVSAMSMPLGLNTVVIPAAYGKDTSTAAGMALISHLCSVLTIPIVFTVVEKLL